MERPPIEAMEAMLAEHSSITHRFPDSRVVELCDYIHKLEQSAKLSERDAALEAAVKLAESVLASKQNVRWIGESGMKTPQRGDVREGVPHTLNNLIRGRTVTVHGIREFWDSCDCESCGGKGAWCPELPSAGRLLDIVKQHQDCAEFQWDGSVWAIREKP